MNTREKILDAASRLFHEQGFAATGVATILREADVNSGSLYHFFSSKDALLEGVLNWYLDRLYPEIMQPLEASESDPLARVFSLLGWYRGFLENHDCRLGCPVGNLALEVSDTHPELRSLIDRNFENWVGIIHGWLNDAGDALPRHCNRRELACMVLTVMEGGIMQARASASLAPYDQSVSQLRHYIEALKLEARFETIPMAGVT